MTILPTFQILVLCATAVLVLLSHLQVRAAKRIFRQSEAVRQRSEEVRQEAQILLQENRRVIQAFHDGLLPNYPNPSYPKS